MRKAAEGNAMARMRLSAAVALRRACLHLRCTLTTCIASEVKTVWLWLQVWIVEGGEVRKWGSDFADYKDSLIQEIKEELDEDDRAFGRSNAQSAHKIATANA